MEKKETCESCHFHLQLLLKGVELHQFPFTRLVIERGVTEEEYTHTLHLVEELHSNYEKDRSEGLVDYTPLLLHFAGMLTCKLPIKDTLIALREEGIYPALAKELLQIKT
ncbi:DUF1878 family protein [Halobacillus rhizosphaerae]|uniref:DUF1878 family protein n=1 Tax=Halobacillus rhizosphaerae TaxID=3064889 RepID=UPI00398A74F5